MNDSSPLISVVIPCLNVEATLGVQLEALVRQDTDFEWEVIVVDNDSTDSTRSVAASFNARLPKLTVTSELRRGRHHACNHGARMSCGQFLVFVDGDDEVMPGFLSGMAVALRSHDLVAGRIDHLKLAEGGLQHGPPITDGVMDGYGFMKFATGGCTGIRRDVFHAVGGFSGDAEYCEDTDLSWRVQLAGFDLGLATDSVLAQRQRLDYRSMFRQHRRFGRARVWLYREYRSHGMARRTIREAIGTWARLVASIPHLRQPDVKTRWIRRLARNVGFVQGSVQYRTFFP